ncbi:SH3 domain-containing protein [Streptomyces sp. HNM0574]|nr:SH3 domain-containing protein [Streptomyces sp. HNM0574]
MGASLAGAGVAHSSPADTGPDTRPITHTEVAPHKPYGTVTSRTGLNVRARPSTSAPVVGFLKYREQVGLKCKVRTVPVDGNPIWYKLRSQKGWVTARYIKNTGSVPWCHRAPDVTENAGNSAAPKG